MRAHLMLRFAALACLPLIVPGIYGKLAHEFAASAAALTAAPVTSDRISVGVAGQGPDVILIPGLASSAHVWDMTIAHIATTHRVHVVQLAGFAGTAPGSNADGPVLEPVVDAIHDYIAANHLEGAAVIGHSLGGLMAMRLAVAHPSDAGQLMVVDALPYAGMMFGASATPAMVEPQVRGMRDRLIAGTQEAYAAAEPQQMARLIKSTGESARAAVAAAVASDRRVVAQALYDDMTTDVRADLAKITVPVTILYPGNASSGAPQEMIDALYTGAFAALPHGKVERVDDSYHFIMIDQPTLFLQKVDAFLAG